MSVALRNLRAARDLADRESASDLDLPALAAAAGMSRFHFIRAFAETYGVTPIRYLSRRRITRAQDLLRSTDLTVTEIAGEVGFASLGSFTSRFTALVGRSPVAYRELRAADGSARVPGCVMFMRGLDAVGPDEQSGRSPAGGRDVR